MWAVRVVYLFFIAKSMQSKQNHASNSGLAPKIRLYLFDCEYDIVFIQELNKKKLNIE